MRGAPRFPVLVLAAILAVGVAQAGAVKVPIRPPLPARMDVEGVKTILITKFLAGDDPDLSLSDEMVKALRRLLSSRTHFQILDVDAPSLPEQNLAELLENKEYWQEMGRRYGADLIVSGQIGFDANDQSGFVQESYVSPVTGQQLQRTRYTEREGFEMNLTVLFFRGDSGELAYKDPFREEMLFDEKGADHLQVFFNLLERVEPEILGILTAHWRTEYRNLFTD